MKLGYQRLWVTSNYTIQQCIEAIGKTDAHGSLQIDEQLLSAIQRRFLEIVI